MTTTITTTARRIQRELATTPDTMTVRFDADGQVVETHEAGMWHADKAPSYAYKMTGGRMTQAQVQDAMDWQDFNRTGEL